MGIQLPVVSYGDSEPFYGSVPLDRPLQIKAGGTVGVCIFCSSWRGVVLRAKLGEATGWQPGDLTDENEDLSLHAGILPRNDEGYQDTMFTKVCVCMCVCMCVRASIFVYVCACVCILPTCLGLSVCACSRSSSLGSAL